MSALWRILLVVVAFCLAETRVWGFAVTPQPASGVFEFASLSSVGESTTATGYDAIGQTLTRTYSQNAVPVRTQTFTWDALGRLVKLSERDAQQSGQDFTAVYDGLNRRIRTQTEAVVNHVPASSPTLATQSDYDPLVEFLEVGLALNGERTWKIHGPDLSGGYGGMQGIGGLEATIVERSGVATGLLSDRFGHILAHLEGEGAATTVNWQPAKLGGYGALPGSPLPKLAIDADVATVTAWRSRSADPTGLIYLGARYYDPETGRFLTPDPAGHAASFSLYDYAGGDPVNFLDPDGRFATESGKEALDLGLRAWDGIKELGLIGSDMMGHTAASVFGYGDHYEGSSQLYQNIAAHPENYTEQGMRDSILDGALAVERNLITLGLYDTIRGFEHAAATGDYRDAQDASLAMLLLNLGLRSDPLVGRPRPNGVPPSSNTETPSAVVQDVAAREGGWKPTPFNPCFAPGTHVLMADGSTKPIEEVEEGDEVLAEDPGEEGEPSAHRVTQVHKNWTLRFIHVAVDEDGDGSSDGEVKATGEHPFWTENRGWVAAKDLVFGDQLRDENGRSPRVLSAESVPVTSVTYNLSVEGVKTFFALAGDTALLVHNTDPIFPLEVRPYSHFRLYPGDNLVGHEMLQNAWLKANGYSAFKPQNPSLALPTSFHVSEVNPRQAAAGLWDRTALTGQSAYDNIRANIRVLDNAGVPRDVIAEQARAARSFAKSLPCP
jgi:RHS repeat-associated protein